MLLRDPSGNFVEVERPDEYLDVGNGIALYKINERLRLAAPCGKRGGMLTQ